MIHKGLVSSSSDYIFHWQRLNELSGSLSHFKLPQFNEYSNVPYGIATPTMYPWLSLVPVLLLKSFITKPIALIYSAYALFLFIGFNVSYYTCKNYMHSGKQSLLLSIFYIMSSIPLEYVYNDGDFGAFTATVLAPIVFFGWLHWIHDSKHWRMMTVGLLLMMGCHLLSTIIMIVFLGIVSLVFHKSLINHLKSFIKASITFILISSLIWLPLLILLLSNKIEQPIMMLLKDSGELLIPDPVFLVVPSRLDVWTYTDLFSIVLTLIYWKRLSKGLKELFWIAIGFILANFNWLPWNLIQKTWISKLQFVCRINFVSHLILSFLLAYIIVHIISKRWYKQNVIALLVIMSVFIFGGSLASQWECTFFKGSTGNPITKHYKIPESGNHQISPQKLQKEHLSATSKKFFFPRLDNHSLSMPQMIHFGFCYDYAPLHLSKDNGEKVVISKYRKIKSDPKSGYIHFHLNSPAKKATLPLIVYHQQKYDIISNHHKMPYSISHNRIQIHHLKKGSYNVRMQIPIMWYRWLTLIFAIIGIAILVIRKQWIK